MVKMKSISELKTFDVNNVEKKINGLFSVIRTALTKTVLSGLPVCVRDNLKHVTTEFGLKFNGTD